MVAPGTLAPIIADAGTSFTKVGFADEDIARSISATSAGLSHPIDRGYVRHHDHMSVIFEDIFDFKLGVDPSQHGVVLTEPLNNSPLCAERSAASMFETFHVPFVGMVPAAAMALYASGRETGVAIDVGGGLLQVLPMMNGDPVAASDGSGLVRLSAHLGGNDITQKLAQMLMPHRGAWLRSEAEYRLMEDVKNKTSFVCGTPEGYDLLEHQRQESQVDYTMPDGITFSVGHEAAKAGEFLFRPELGMTPQGVQGYFAAAMGVVPEEAHEQLLQNVVLAGGTTLTTGFQQRAIWELSQTMGSDVRVLAKPERQYLSWIGASVVSTLSPYSGSWMSAADFEEMGSSLVHRKGMFTQLRADEDAVLADAFFAPPKVKQLPVLKPVEPPTIRTATANSMSLWRAAVEGDVANTLAALEGAEAGVINAGDPHNNGFTALHFAARYGNADVISELVNAGADMTAVDDYGKTALHWTAEYNQSIGTSQGSKSQAVAEAVNLLIKAKCDVSAQDSEGRTAVHYAARAGQAQVMNLLIAAGANVDAPDKTGRTARDWAHSTVADSLPPQS